MGRCRNKGDLYPLFNTQEKILGLIETRPVPETIRTGETYQLIVIDDERPLHIMEVSEDMSIPMRTNIVDFVFIEFRGGVQELGRRRESRCFGMKLKRDDDLKYLHQLGGGKFRWLSEIFGEITYRYEEAHY